MRILFALSGLNRVERGAEIAFKAIGSHLAQLGHAVTLIGSGPPVQQQAYRYVQARGVRRERFERFPKLPLLRNEAAWEDATFATSLLRTYDPSEFDITLTCAYPFTNWVLRRKGPSPRPPHVFVTQNGDWPAFSNAAEYRWFGCDGLVCINPAYLERNEARYQSALIPNGVDLGQFSPGPPRIERFTDSPAKPLILMVSALILSKNVAAGIRAVALVPGAQLIVAGDGPLRDELQDLGNALLPGRYRQVMVAPSEMPDLYRSADAFMHLSEDESFGNVYVEALACGVPVVARDTPHTRWVLGEAGYLAQGLGPVEIAAELARGLNGRPHKTEAGLDKAAGFSWPRIATAYADFLETVIAEKSRS